MVFFEAIFNHPLIGSARRRFRPEAVVSAPATTGVHPMLTTLYLYPYKTYIEQAAMLNMLEGFSVPWCDFASNPFPY